MDPHSVDVIIIGAGPTGLVAACELTRRGVGCRIVDANPGPSEHSKATGIHARTMELLEHMGLVEAFLERGTGCHGLSVYRRGTRVAQVAMDGIPSKYPYFCVLSQRVTEAILLDRLSALGVSVEWGTKLDYFHREDYQVTAHLERQDSRTEAVQCRYLLGCDGANSTVRKQLGLLFPGGSYTSDWLLIDGRLEWPYRHDEIAAFLHPEGGTAYFPLGPRRGRLMFELRGRDDRGPASVDLARRLAEEREIRYRHLGEPSWLTYYKLHHRTAERYGRGRVFVAGDAAHVCSPIGSQGMNTGIQDAYNLSWKLALVLRRQAPVSLLDSYEAERLPIGEEVVHMSDRATRVLTSRGTFAGAIWSALLGAGVHLEPAQRRLLGALSQVTRDYRHSPIVAQDWRPLRSAPEPDPRPGVRLDDAVLRRVDGSTRRLYDLLNQTTGHVLLLLTNAPATAPATAAMADLAARVQARYGGSISVCLVTGSGSDADTSGDAQEAAGSAIERAAAAAMSALERAAAAAMSELGQASAAATPALAQAASDATPALARAAITSTPDSVLIDPGQTLHARLGVSRPSAYVLRPDGHIGFRSQPVRLAPLLVYLDPMLGTAEGTDLVPE
ncbi:FAD-dependent monooxygenase [Haliangium sp.]|uniref:FAD-dependent monooxygenase n=1 Tax=Haliangium sp. TaxID=2663208 RepID=UPI003D11CBCE